MIREYKEELDFNPLTNADQVSYNPTLPSSPPPPPISREFSICTTDGFCDGKTPNVASSPQRLSGHLRVVESGWPTDDKVDACAHDSKCQFNRPRFVRRANRKLHIIGAKQAAVKKDRIRDVDLANNPNWEFLQMIREYKEELDFNPLTNADQISYNPPSPSLPSLPFPCLHPHTPLPLISI